MTLLVFDMVLLEFLAQRAAVDTEAGSRFRLVVVAVPQDRFQHGLLDFGNDRIEKVAGQFAIQVLQILSNRLFYRLL